MRSIQKLRISLTDSCNFRCLYCMPDDVSFQDKKEHLSFEQILQVVRVMKKFYPLKTVRITGGEPLLRKNVPELVSRLHEEGIEDIGLTTNAYFLKNQIQDLISAGLSSVNISLDSLEKKSFYQMASLKEHDAYERVMEALDLCLNSGLKVKTNTVVMKGLNDDQILPILKYSREKGFYPRFLELMSLGEGRNYTHQLFSMQNMLTLIHAEFGRSHLVESPQDSTSVNLITSQGFRFGIIASETEPFCQNCSRLRLSADGKIFGCLMKNEGLSIKQDLDDEEALYKTMEQAISMKPYYRIYSSETPMYSLGG